METANERTTQPAGRDNVSLTETLPISSEGGQFYSSPCVLSSLLCGVSEKKTPLWGSVKYHIFVSVHLGMSGGSQGQSPSPWHRERPPVWREPLRKSSSSAPPAVAGGVRQHAPRTGEVPALFGSRCGHAGEHWWSQSSSKSELVVVKAQGSRCLYLSLDLHTVISVALWGKGRKAVCET